MSAPSPASLDFENVPIGTYPSPAILGTLQFTVLTSDTSTGAYNNSQVMAYGGSNHVYIYQTSLGSASTNVSPALGFAISAANAGTFSPESINVISERGQPITITGYDANGGIVTAATIDWTGAATTASVTYTSGVTIGTYGTGMLNFSQAWSHVSKVAFNGSAASGGSYGGFGIIIDDIVLQPTSLDLAPGSDSGSSATDHVTNIGAPTLTGIADANATVDVYVDGGTAAVTTAAADASGAFKLANLAAFADGAHTVTVIEQGATSVSASVTFTIDTVAAAPAGLTLDATLDVGAASDHKTSDITPQISGTAEANASIVLFDGAAQVGTAAANAQGAWQTSTTELADGTHSLTAVQTDVAGNTSVASDALAITVASGRPSAPVLADASDSGIKGDNLTNVQLPTFTGTALANATVTLIADGGDPAGTATADTNGNWSITVGQGQSKIDGLLDGTHTLHAEITVGAGNPSSSPAVLAGATLTLNVDTTAPLPADAPTLNKASNSGAFGDNVTAITTPTLDGHAERNATVAIYDNGTLLDSTKADSEGLWHYTTGTLAAGAHALTVVETDAAGNASPTGAALNLTIDVAAAAPTGLALDPTYGVGNNAGDTTRDVTPLITGRAEANAYVTLFDGGTAVGSAGADGDGFWQIATSALDDGVHALSARQVDPAGNASTASATLTINVASGRPSTPLLADTSDSGTKGDAITNDATPTFSGTTGANLVVGLFDGTTAVGSTLSDANGNWSITVGDLLLTRSIVPTALADGVHQLTAAIQAPSDALAGTSGTTLYSAPVTLTVDTIAPVAPAAPTLDAASHAGTDNSTTVRTPTLHGQAEHNATVAIYDNGALLGTTSANSEGTWNYTTARLATGAHTITTTQADVAGNVSQAGDALALTLKAAPVPVTAPTTVDGVAVTSGSTVLAGGTAGTAIAIPVVTADRVEQSGATGTADIPLATTGGNALLTAQVHTGFGLNASGATVSGDALAELIAAIKATGSAHGNTDLAHLAADGQSFLSLLPADGSLHVQTVQLTGSAQGSAVDLVAGTDATQVALVIDGTGVAAGTAVSLNNIPFASVFGALSVSSTSHGQILSGDSAAQTFSVGADAGSKVLAGGGADTLAFTAAPAATAGASADVAPGTVATTAVTTTLLHGGSGADTAVFGGNADAYTVDQHDGYVLVSSTAAPAQVAQLVNVESLQFADKTVALQATDAQQTLAALYENVLDRQADVYGFDFWAGAEKAGLSLGTIALDMVTSNEGVARFGALNGDSAHDVGIVYQAVFGRAADAAGSTFWVSQMAHGATLAQVTDAVAHSVEIVGQQQAATAWDFSV